MKKIIELAEKYGKTLTCTRECQYGKIMCCLSCSERRGEICTRNNIKICDPTTCDEIISILVNPYTNIFWRKKKCI